MIIMKYKNHKDLEVFFPEYNYFTNNRTYNEFKLGTIKCPYEPRLFNIGYTGEGEYLSTNKNPIYIKWYNMLTRCYDSSHKNYSQYKDCEVCEEWHNFQSFAQWYENNYYEIPNEKMELDKDILIKGNKIYSPETCNFVPHTINILFTNRKEKRGEFPIGIVDCSSTNKTKPYKVCISKRGKKINLGYSASQIKAMFSASAVNETEIFKISIRCSNPEHAQRIVDAIIEIAPAYIKNTVKAGSVEIIDAASLPKSPSYPNVATDTIKGFLAGAVLCLGVLVAINFLDRRIHSDDDITESYNIPLLGIIPEIQSTSVSKEVAKR